MTDNGKIYIKSVLTDTWREASFEEALRWAQCLHSYWRMDHRDINRVMLRGVTFTRQDMTIKDPPNIWRGFRKDD